MHVQNSNVNMHMEAVIIWTKVMEIISLFVFILFLDSKW